MKKIISHIVAVVILISFIISCDFVKNANPPVEPNSGTGNVTPGIVYRKVLIEDYTGHKCGYCPPAGDTLAYLEKKYTGKIIPLAIHAGQFANINLTYPTDFRTTVGNAYDTEFGNSMAGNPNGLINRIGFGTGSFIKSYT